METFSKAIAWQRIASEKVFQKNSIYKTLFMLDTYLCLTI